MGKILCLHVLQVRDLGKILCLHVLQVKDLLLTQKSSKGTGRKCNERIKDQQPLNSQDVFPTPSFHLPCALTDPGTGGISSVTCQSKKWWLLKVLMLHARGIHSPILPLQSWASAAQSSLREHGTNSRAGLPRTRGQRIAAQLLRAADLSPQPGYSFIHSFLPAAQALPVPGIPRDAQRLPRSAGAQRPRAAVPGTAAAPRSGSAPQKPLEKIKHARSAPLGVWGVLGSLSVNEIGSKEAKSPWVLMASYFQFQICTFFLSPKEKDYKDTHKVSVSFEG